MPSAEGQGYEVGHLHSPAAGSQTHGCRGPWRPSEPHWYGGIWSASTPDAPLCTGIRDDMTFRCVSFGIRGRIAGVVEAWKNLLLLALSARVTRLT